MNRFELADAMLKGLKTYGVIESRGYYLDADSATCMACAMGAAVIGKFNGDFKQAQKAWLEARNLQGEYDALSELLDIPASLAIEIEHEHLNGMPIEQIAAWLKSSEPEVKTNV